MGLRAARYQKQLYRHAESFLKRAIKLADEGHQGMVRTNPDSDRRCCGPTWTSSSGACHSCQPVGLRSKAEAIVSSTLPVGPWTDIAVDILEVPGDNHLVE